MTPRMRSLWLLCCHHLRLGKLPLTIWSGLMFLMSLATAASARAGYGASAAGVAGKVTPFGWVDAEKVVRDGDPQLIGTLATAVVAAAVLAVCLALYGHREVLK